MPRQPRLHVPGGLYHVFARGIERKDIFRDDADRNEFLARLDQALSSANCRCYAWALMPNHVHLLLRPGNQPLANAMRRLLTGYAIHFNRRHRRVGYLFQNRFKSILCQEDVYFLQLIRYIHLNPVRAGLLQNVGSLENYPWTGHPVLLGKKQVPWQDTGDVLSRFSSQKNRAVKAYLRYMGEAEGLKENPNLMGGGLKRSAGGWSGVFDLRRGEKPWVYDSRILGDGDFVSASLKESENEYVEKLRFQKEGWDIEKLINTVCETMGVAPSEIRNKGRNNNVSRCRSLVAYIGRKMMGFPAGQIQKALSLSQPALSMHIQRGEKEFREKPIKL